MSNNYICSSAYDTLTLDEVISGNYNNKKIPQWIDMDDETVLKFAALWNSDNSFNESDDELKSSLDFTSVFGREYLEEFFPGFEPHVYEILMKEDSKINPQELFLDPVPVVVHVDDDKKEC